MVKELPAKKISHYNVVCAKHQNKYMPKEQQDENKAVKLKINPFFPLS